MHGAARPVRPLTSGTTGTSSTPMGPHLVLRAVRNAPAPGPATLLDPGPSTYAATTVAERAAASRAGAARRKTRNTSPHPDPAVLRRGGGRSV